MAAQNLKIRRPPDRLPLMIRSTIKTFLFSFCVDLLKTKLLAIRIHMSTNRHPLSPFRIRNPTTKHELTTQLQGHPIHEGFTWRVDPRW